MNLEEYTPVSKLVTAETHVMQPRFPVVDAHNHVGIGFGGGWVNKPLSELLEVMDEVNVQVLVDMDGGWGEDILQQHLEHFKKGAPNRFAHFGGVNWSKFPELGNRFGEWAAARLKEQIRWGAQGLKIWKVLGLHVKDQNGQLVKVDDPRLDPIWATAAEFEVPVLIHIADPVAFFDPLDANNERWEELHANPDWQFPSPPFPSFLSIVESMANLVMRHPNTTFIGAHVGCYAENLQWVASLLDRAPNFNVDISARTAELGRQPYSARRFFNLYADRILFGLDMAPNVDEYRIQYRFLESEDEYFNYSTSPLPPQGRWMVYGLGLDDDVLQKVYFANAGRIILHEDLTFPPDPTERD